MYPSRKDWVLRVSAFLGMGGLDLVADISRWKRSNWMPVVLVTHISEQQAEGVSLTARTGILLGDIQEVARCKAADYDFEIYYAELAGTWIYESSVHIV